MKIIVGRLLKIICIIGKLDAIPENIGSAINSPNRLENNADTIIETIRPKTLNMKKIGCDLIKNELTIMAKENPITKNRHNESNNCKELRPKVIIPLLSNSVPTKGARTR